MKGQGAAFEEDILRRAKGFGPALDWSNWLLSKALIGNLERRGLAKMTRRPAASRRNDDITIAVSQLPMPGVKK